MLNPLEIVTRARIQSVNDPYIWNMLYSVCIYLEFGYKTYEERETLVGLAPSNVMAYLHD